MNRWSERLRFLWEEEAAPPGETSPASLGESAGVPRPVRRAARFGLTGVVGISLMCQVIGIRLVAPVDAAPCYADQCVADCELAYEKCVRKADKQKDDGCSSSTYQRALDSCLKKFNSCRKQCNRK